MNSTATEGDCEVSLRSSRQHPPGTLVKNAIDSSHEPNPSSRIISVRGVAIGHVADESYSKTHHLLEEFIVFCQFKLSHQKSLM